MLTNFSVSVPKRILITRKTGGDVSVRSFASEHGVELIEQSFIYTSSVRGLDIPKTDWIFFSSPTAVNLFVETYPSHVTGKKLAALGPATARSLESHHLPVTFTGNPDITPPANGKSFGKFIDANEIVLFPISQISRKSASFSLGEQQKVELITYTTEPLGKDVAAADIILFTSPSNLKGFLLKNDVPDKAILLCYGETTAAEIKTLDLSNELINLRSTDQKKLVEVIKRLIV